MTDITPADLAKFIYPVPVGATFPAGMEVMEFSRTAGYFRGPFRYHTHTCTQLADEPPRWTAEPLTAPRPPLPTEVGAVIANVVPLFDWRNPQPADTCAVMVLGGNGRWFGVDASGGERCYAPDEITDWTPARIVTDEAVGAAEPDLMDESDKRPRIDADGDRVEWSEADRDWACDGGAGCPTLAEHVKEYARIVGWADR